MAIRTGDTILYLSISLTYIFCIRANLRVNFISELKMKSIDGLQGTRREASTLQKFSMDLIHRIHFLADHLNVAKPVLSLIH
jgi:hypothetical protein